MKDLDPQVSISRWLPSIPASRMANRGLGTYAEGSPMLGIALDGFPIHGPYNSQGNLITTSQLGECNFDFETQRYHFTPTFLLVPHA